MLKNSELPKPPWNVSELSRRDSVLIETIHDNLNQAIEIDEELSRFAGSRDPPLEFARLPNTFALRGQLLENLGKVQEAKDDLGIAKLMIDQNTAVINLEQPEWAVHLRDVWTWRNPVMGHKLLSQDKHARLIAVQLGNDFTATSNIGILNGLEQVVRNLRAQRIDFASPELQVQISGSAAFGADMLRAASSVALNLSEGSAKRSPADRRRFYEIALGSVRECEAIVELLEAKRLKEPVDKLARHVYKLVRAL